MAITVTGKNFLEISNCESDSDGGSWTILTTQDSDNVKQGTYSLCGIMKSSGNNDATFTPSSSKDLLNRHVRFWLILAQGKLINLYANGGIQFWCSDGTNTGYWYVGGRDTYPGGWHNFVIDLSKPVDAGTKPSGMGAITSMGIRLNLTAAGKNAVNTWIDSLCACDGLITYGDKAGGYYDFEDIFAITNEPTTGGLGIMTKKAGVYCLAGSMEFGGASSTTKFQAKSQAVVFENRPGKAGITNNINANLMKFSVVDSGNASYTTEFILGDKVGGQGISGCTIRTQSLTQLAKFGIDGSTDTDVDNFKIYGSTILDANAVSFPLAATNVEVLNCNFESCGEILASTCIVQNCNIISADDRGLRIVATSPSKNVTNCNFINCPRAVHIASTGTYDFDGLNFSGNVYDIDNSSGATVTINSSNSANPPSTYINSLEDTQENWSAAVVLYSGSYIRATQRKTISNKKIAKMSCLLKKGGSPTGDVTYKVRKAADLDAILQEITVGDASILTTEFAWYERWFITPPTINQEIRMGTEFSGGNSTNRVEVCEQATDVKAGEYLSKYDTSWVDQTTRDFAYRLLLHDTSITTNIINTVYLTVDVEDEDGDPVIDAAVYIEKASNKTELMRELTVLTEGKGRAQESYNYSPPPFDINVRVRKSSTGTRYIPYKTTGEVTANGYNLTVVLIKDLVLA